MVLKYPAYSLFCRCEKSDKRSMHEFVLNSTLTEFSIEVRNRFQILEVQQTTDIGAEVSVEEKGSHVKEAYHSTSKNILGIKKRQHKEWISLET